MLKEFYILGYTDGSVKIIIYFSEKKPILPKYLRQFDLTDNDNFDSLGSYSAIDPKQVQSFFKVISDNNEIPDDYLKKIRKIVDEYAKKALDAE